MDLAINLDVLNMLLNMMVDAMMVGVVSGLLARALRGII